MAQEVGTPTTVDYLGAAARAASGSAVVAASIIPVAIVTAVLDEDSLGIPVPIWRSLAWGALGIASVAVVRGVARACVAVVELRMGVLSDQRQPWPRAETVGLLAVLACCGLLALYVFGSLIGSCDDLPYGSDRTACSMGGGFLAIILLFFGGVLWLVGSYCFGLTWVIRTWWDIGRRRKRLAHQR